MQRFLLPLLVVLIVGFVRAEGQPTKDDARNLMGDWVLSELEVDNKKQASQTGSILRFMGDKVEMVGENKPATYKLGKEKDLFWIDITPEGGKEKTIKAIYELKGDVLRICYSTDPEAAMNRPKEFSTKTAGTILLTFKREKK